MGRGYAGANVIAELEMDYYYMGHEYDDFGDITNLMTMNLYFAQNTDNYATNIEHIGEQAVQYARSFLEQHNKTRTWNLYKSVQFTRKSSNQWQLSAPARDSRKKGKQGHLYAGHIEYGFTDKAGKSHGPWPFLRPAMRLAAMDSRGELANALSNYALYGSDFAGNQLALGRSGQIFNSSKGYDAFASLSNTFRGSDNSGNSREWGSAINGFNDYSGAFPSGTSSNSWTSSSFSMDWGDL